MNIHEYQAKGILKKYGLPVPDFHVASSLKDVQDILHKTGWTSAVIKMQVHAGGRGKAGGVKMARTPAEILEFSQELLGKKMVNHQTGPEGMVAHQILISQPISIVQEYYLGMTISRELRENVLIASPFGGMDIEEIAKKDPEQVLILPLPSQGAFRSYHFIRLGKLLGWDKELMTQGVALIKNLVRLFIETDASLVEINPLVRTEDGRLLALDAKLSVDENALYRQPEIKGMFDPTQVPRNEAKAVENDLAYIALEGEIGCMVNGAGLAMATMDMIDYYGGSPANFLDVGGSATKEKVAEGFKIILSDPKVKAILVNIFGGIMNCETLAAGVIDGVRELQLTVPVVVRMEGTNVEKGRKLIQEAGLKIFMLQDFKEAAQTVVKLSKAGEG